MLDLKKIDKSWTLFLDRDGVINIEKYLEYVLDYAEFKFGDRVLLALKTLTGLFGRLILVTNQRGVEKKLMTEDALMHIHTEMMKEIEINGGKLDAIFYCTALNDDHPNRKPQPGMAFLAKERFRDIEFSKSIMIGNKPSDMMFGRNAGMYTVFVQTTDPHISLPHQAIDMVFKDLPEFTDSIKKTYKV